MTKYFTQTRTATYAFWSAMPLLLLYEWLILMANRGSAMQIRVGADVWLKQALASMGARGHLLLGASVAVIGLIIFFRERKQSIELKAGYFVGMLVESIVYAIVVTLIVSNLVMRMFPAGLVAPLAAGGGGGQPSLLLNLALSLGAGLYEELFFRVLLYGGIFMLLRKLTGEAAPALLVAAVVSSLLFSGAHHLGSLGDPFTASVFTYRFLYGLALQALYLTRGFGVAAWTHALYDVMVVTMTGQL